MCRGVGARVIFFLFTYIELIVIFANIYTAAFVLNRFKAAEAQLYTERALLLFLTRGIFFSLFATKCCVIYRCNLP